MMSDERLIAVLTDLIQQRDRLLEMPGARSAWEILTFLASVSSGFWVGSRIMGLVALGLTEVLDRSLAILFAVFYNIALAAAFASVMVFAVVIEKKQHASYLTYLGGGFVFVYLILGAVYADSETARLDEYGLLGFFGGALSYLAFAVKQAWLSNPLTPRLYAICDALPNTIVGRLIIAFTLYEIGRRAVLGLRGRLLRRAIPLRRHA